MEKFEERIKKALDVLVEYGGIDGAHHKMWVIDQAIRHLLGCPVFEETLNINGKPRTFITVGESEEYKILVANSCAGEDGPDTYSWDVGINP